MPENVVSHFNSIFGDWNCNSNTDAVSVQITVDIVLADVGLCGGTEASTHDVSLQMSKRNDCPRRELK